MRIEADYIRKEVPCECCGKMYIPNNTEAKEELNVPVFLANNFCSRKCYDNMRVKVVL
jgi:hypothetical protein